MPSIDYYWLRDLLHTACGSAAQSSDCASALQLSKHDHWRGTYVLDIVEYDGIDGYHFRLGLLPPAEDPMAAKWLFETLPPWQFQPWPTPKYTQWECWLFELGHKVEILLMESLLDVFLFSPLLFFPSLDLGPVHRTLEQVFTTRQWLWIISVCRSRRKVSIELFLSVEGLMI
jgi:hypothetical protein